MKKRLDIQSLLENSEKQDLVLFLKNAFTLHADLTDHFLIHFASKFELDEMDFQLIMDRIKHMIPNSLSEMTHRKANKVRDHIRDLIDQARDCQSREDYRQAFVIVSHVLRLLDQYSDLIAEKFRFHTLPYQCYQLLDGIHRDSPAPELKSRMILFLHELIQEGKAIPWDDQLNPYMLLIEWEKGKPAALAKKLLGYLSTKIQEIPAYRSRWIEQKVRVLDKLNLNGALHALAEEYSGELAFYEALSHTNENQSLTRELLELLRTQYNQQKDRNIKSRIFQILQKHGVESLDFSELAIQEYFLTGDVKILTRLQEDPQICDHSLIEDIANYYDLHPEVENFHLYAAYKHLQQEERLKDALMKETNIYEILPFLDIIYPRYREAVEQKLAALIEGYLASHFGRPALNHINGILDEISRRDQRALKHFLIKTIEHQFGHRKHFQKLMKELV